MTASNLSQTSQIRYLRKGDIPVISAIHIQQFPGSRSTSLGEPFLCKMYKWFLINQPQLSWVAEQNGIPVGFVVGAIGGYGRKMFRYALPEVLLGFILHPRILFRARTFNLWHSYLKGLLPRHSTSQPVSVAPSMVSASLASIAVDQAAQGKGIGKALVRTFENAARDMGAARVGLSVEADNIAARRTYESCGWRLNEQNSNAASAYYDKVL